MTIYTKTGDSGITSLYGDKRVLKSDPQVETYGSIDELSSFIGLVITKLKDKKQKESLIRIQKDLYSIMSFLAGKSIELNPLKKEISKFEQNIDKIESRLPKLNRFILPGGTEISAWFHILRTICRRAERGVVNYLINNKTIEQLNNELIIKYLNRLSDLFFVLARKHNKSE